MLPEGSHNKIRLVSIHYFGCITGFSFFDKEGALLWKIGRTASWLEVETVLIGENEVIVSLVAKLQGGWQNRYSIFQFQIAPKPDFN